MTTYLDVSKTGDSYVSETCPNNSHNLGMVVDGFQSIFKIEDGVIYQIKVYANENNHWRNDWEPVTKLDS